MLISQFINELHFHETNHVEGRESIADLFKPGKRCGIYLLHFANGEYYIGQAKDVTRRYVQHRKSHHDIQCINFRRTKPEELNEIERSAIHLCERGGFTLRNITFMSMPLVDADFDLIMPAEQQACWLDNLAFVDQEGDRPVNPELRQRYATRFAQFQQQPFAQQSLKVLRTYVQYCLPAIKRGEISFWSCSCLPAYKGEEAHMYARINIYWQEVFNIYRQREYRQGELMFSWQVALSPLEKAFGQSLWKLRLRFPFLKIDRNHIYQPGGADQIKLVVKDSASALRLLSQPDILKAMRLFNLRLMRKGACTYSRYHCLDLADSAII